MPEVKLGDIAQERREVYKGDKALSPVVGLEHLTPGEIRLSAWDVGGDNTFSKAFFAGDVLFGRRRAYLKKAAQATVDGLCSGDITVIQARASRVSPDLLPFIIQNDAFFEFAVENSAGSLSPRVKWEHLANYEIDLPSMDEQRKLASLLWAAYELKGSYERLLRASDEMAKSRFIEMFGDPKTNPYGYDLSKLRNTCSVITGNTPSRSVPQYYGNFIEWIKTDNIVPGVVNPTHAMEGLSQKGMAVGRTVDEGAMLMACIAGSIASIGKLCITNRKVAFNQQINAIIPRDYDIRFLYVMLQISKNYLIEDVSKSLKGILSKTKLEDKVFFVPPIALQKQFAAFVEELDKSKVELQRCIADTDSIIKGLQNQMHGE